MRCKLQSCLIIQFILSSIQSIQQIKLTMMYPDPLKKTRLAVQDLNRFSSLDPQRPSISRQMSLPPKVPYKKISNDPKSQRRPTKFQDNHQPKMMSSKGLSNWAQPSEYDFSSRKILFLPQASFECNSSNDIEENPEDRLQSYSSIRLNRVGFHRLQKDISERYQKKVEVLKQFKMPKISQQLLTLSHFTHQALNSIPKHVQIFNEKLKLLKKSLVPPSELDKYQKKKEPQLHEMPEQLKTLRVIRKISEDKSQILLTRKTQNKFRMYLTKKSSKSEAKKPEVFKIEGWQSQKNEKQRNLFY